MAGPDNPVRRNDGIVRAEIEAYHADPLEFDISIKLITVAGEFLGSDGEQRTWERTFPAIEIEGFEESDEYRFAPPGTSWSEENVVEEETVEAVPLSELDINE